MAPSASLRLVKLRPYLDTKVCIWPTSDRAAMPTKVTFELAAATRLTPGASALQNGHHGVQNHSTAGLPCRLAPLNGAPPSGGAVNCRRSSAAAERGASASPNIRAAAKRAAANNLSGVKSRINMASPRLLV